jgi:predicted dehydrogenase
MRPRSLSRRSFLRTASLTTASLVAGPWLCGASGGKRLRIGLVGTGGRGVNMVRDILQLEVDVIALCDVDPIRGNTGAKLALERWPAARRYLDYRKMFDQEAELEAVIVTTPDHMHAPITLLAMSRGLHVFCEKPLTRTIGEARRVRDLARRSGVVTQMGTQGSASHTLRRAVEVIQAGAIGTVREVHIWCDRTPGLPDGSRPVEMPEGMDWDVWLGVAAARPFDRRICPFHWRWWTDFGSGPLGDMGCHLTNIAFRALDLADPASIDVQVGPVEVPGMFPQGTTITYEFPQRGARAPVKFTWYDGGARPDPALLEHHGIPQQFGRVPVTEKLIIGDRGVLYGDAYFKLHGEPRFLGTMKHEACLAVPQTIPRAREQGTLGHYREWVDACQGHGRTYTGFDVAAAQTEMVLLGALAVQLGGKIRWDADAMRVPDEPAADALIRPVYRPGFTID